MKCPSPLLVPVVALLLSACARTERLPAPVVHGHSFELLTNSRYSTHSGFSDTLPRQVLANVLWAMSRVPALGSLREFYVATPANLYRYDPGQHTLMLLRDGDMRSVQGSAFEIGIAAESEAEAGLAVQAGLLAGTAFLTPDGGDVAGCPMARPAESANRKWNPAHPVKIVNVYGRLASRGLQTELQARSSDSSLPAPRTDGPDTFEVLLKRLRVDTVFDPAEPALPELSQILWAGYGVTPHSVSRGRQGLTVPSAMARYFVTGRIYAVRADGVRRYHNRMPPGTDIATSDHRLELVSQGDRRAQLRRACPRLPSTAPAHVVVCLSDTSRGYAAQEAGYVGFQFLMQSRQLGLNGGLTASFDAHECAAIISALGIPETESPTLVFSVGSPRRR